ncbi:hypothetical protein FISHEDRAFT_38620, partial [Fistulina hepatica ATCC 64428]
QGHDEDIVGHLYHFGFQGGNYADTILHIRDHVFRLHAIIISRSPYLVHVMAASPQSGVREIHLDIEAFPEVTLDVTVGYLYSTRALEMVTRENTRSVLAAACLLGGMDELCQYAYEMCRSSIDLDSISHWLSFIESVEAVSADPSNPPSRSLLDHYVQRLKADVFEFITAALPSKLEAPTQQNGRDVLAKVFAKMSFEMFKASVESPTFQIGSDQARFKFAKDVIELRKAAVSGSGAEETVVLAFGGTSSGNSAVHVTRKMRKRPLWKVGC